MVTYNGFAGGRGGVPPTAVHLTALTNGDILRYDSSNERFYNTPLVLSGNVALDDLTDVVITSASNTQFLRHNGSNWVNASVTIVDTLDSLSDVVITTPVNGQFLKYNGSNWVNSTTSSSVSVLDDLTDVVVSGPAAGHLLAYNNGSNWANTSAPRITTIELGAASDTTLSRASAGVLAVGGQNVYTAGGTDVAIADGGTGASTAATARSALDLVSGRIWVPAASMWPTTTTGAVSQTLTEMTTNLNNYWLLDFEDSTSERAEFTIAMPDVWNAGTLTYQAYWMANSTSSNAVVWGLAARALNDGSAADVAQGTEITVTDANAGVANQVRIAAVSSALTVAGSPAAGSLVQFRVRRIGANGSDTLTTNARLMGIFLFYTRT